ncbi:TrbG/VirB9 family P-type conjugative transfer protein [Azohydromonas australica]|uniref:TrbG/VirB9 family P-type conjugative transfer protein n=1 Tax=Azohydromonas australica TaxID=364039 RepID=UPI0003F92930|nr:TrbG/VirB9 family P-type conjugative transfer protein [Azohydromonas australica]
MKAAALALLAAAAQAATAAPISEVVYDPKQVIRIPVARGVPTHVLLEPGETITTDLAAGLASVCRSAAKNSVSPTTQGGADAPPMDAWDLCGPKGQGSIFVKPVGPATLPNPVAFQTNRRNYALQFDVVANPAQASRRVEIRSAPAGQAGGPDQDMRRRLAAAQEMLPTEQEIIEQRLSLRPIVANGDYSKAWGQGSEDIVPAAVWDDGASTYLEYPGHMPVPAVFEVLPGGKEQQVNPRFDPRFNLLVVDRVARGLMLRRGDSQVVSITNQAFDVQGRGAPKGSVAEGVQRIVRDKRTGGFREDGR